MSETRYTPEQIIKMGQDLEDHPEPESDGKKRLLLFVVLPLLLVIGGSAGAYFSGFADPLLKMLGTEESVAAGAAEGNVAQSTQGSTGTEDFYDLPDILVNLKIAGSKKSFLKVVMSLELVDQASVAAVERVLPRVIDQLQTYLRELRIEDLQGSAGMKRLRLELLSRVEADVGPNRVNDILFREVIIQ